MMTTIAESIQQKTAEYVQLYDDMEADDSPFIAEKAKSLALHDPCVRHYIWEEVEKNVREYIEQQEESEQ